MSHYVIILKDMWGCCSQKHTFIACNVFFKRTNVASLRLCFSFVSFYSFYSSVILVSYTYAVHPADVIRGASEDDGLLHDEAAHAVDNPLAADVAVEGVARVTL